MNIKKIKAFQFEWFMKKSDAMGSKDQPYGRQSYFSEKKYVY